MIVAKQKKNALFLNLNSLQANTLILVMYA